MRAYLVLGPESSGTRLMTRILMAAGCLGDDGHQQRFDDELPPARQPIVWRRSMPHNGEWPDIRDLVGRLNEAGYSMIQAVVMNRTWWAMMPSQVSNGHVTTETEALARIRRAYPHIYGQLWAANLGYVVVSYEALIGQPEVTIRHTCDLLDLPMPDMNAISLVDGNLKWANSQATN